MTPDGWVLITSEDDWSAYRAVVRQRWATAPTRPAGRRMPFYVISRQLVSWSIGPNVPVEHILTTVAFGPNEASALLGVTPVEHLNETPAAILRQDTTIVQALVYLLERLKEKVIVESFARPRVHGVAPETHYLTAIQTALDQAGIYVSLTPTGMPLDVPDLSQRPPDLAPETSPDDPGAAPPSRGDLVDL